MKTTECRTHYESLSALLDGELAGEELMAVEAHLEGCPSCMSEFRSLKASFEIVEKNLPVLGVEARVWREIEAEINADLGVRQTVPTPEKPRPSRILRWIPVGAGFGLALYLGILQFLPSSEINPEVLREFNSFIQSRENVRSSASSQDLDWDANPFRESYELDSNPFAVE